MPDYRITVDLDFSQKKLRLSPDRQLNLQASKVCACVWERKGGGDVFGCSSNSDIVHHSCGMCLGTRGSDGQED